jgi:hypothetical protein
LSSTFGAATAISVRTCELSGATALGCETGAAAATGTKAGIGASEAVCTGAVR